MKRDYFLTKFTGLGFFRAILIMVTVLELYCTETAVLTGDFGVFFFLVVLLVCFGNACSTILTFIVLS